MIYVAGMREELISSKTSTVMKSCNTVRRAWASSVDECASVLCCVGVLFRKLRLEWNQRSSHKIWFKSVYLESWLEGTPWSQKYNRPVVAWKLKKYCKTVRDHILVVTFIKKLRRFDAVLIFNHWREAFQSVWKVSGEGKNLKMRKSVKVNDWRLCCQVVMVTRVE